MEFNNTIKACNDDMLARTRNNWAIADAILADIPDTDETRVSLALQNLANELASDGITNHRDELYTFDSLRTMRMEAIHWPESMRHDEASYRTHHEAGNPNNEKGIALAALCAIARGESVECPNGLDESSWNDAIGRVMESRGRFRVSVNTLRIALSRKVNIPQPMPTTTIEMLKLVSDMKAGARHFAKAFGDTDPTISDDEKEGLAKALRDLIETLNGLIVIVHGFTDDDLAQIEDYK